MIKMQKTVHFYAHNLMSLERLIYPWNHHYAINISFTSEFSLALFIITIILMYTTVLYN